MHLIFKYLFSGFLIYFYHDNVLIRKSQGYCINVLNTRENTLFLEHTSILLLFFLQQQQQQHSEGQKPSLSQLGQKSLSFPNLAYFNPSYPEPTGR